MQKVGGCLYNYAAALHAPTFPLHHFVFLLSLTLPQSRSKEMAPKRGGGNTKKEAAGTSHDKEWVLSLLGETELNEMVVAGILP